MNSFAFIIHPSSVNHLKLIFNFLGKEIDFESDFEFKEKIKNISPFEFLNLSDIRSSTGKSINGKIYVCPLVPDQLVGSNQEQAKERIIETVKMASKNSPEIIGLGGFTSVVTGGGADLTAHTKIPLTTGNAFTSFLAMNGIMRAVEYKKLETGSLTLSVIGASGDIGSACSRILAKSFKKIILAARNIARLDSVKNDIQSCVNGTNVEITNDVDKAVSSADVILAAASSVFPILRPELFKLNAIICDVSFPSALRETSGIPADKKVLYFKGGLAKSDCLKFLDHAAIKGIELFDCKNYLFGCISETILLTFANMSRNFSFGKGNISAEQCNEIGNISKDHGFDVYLPFNKAEGGLECS